jgi:ATP-dependent HslUV protease, peptidase subunit HslV
MSTVVAVRKGNQVAIAADSLTSFGSTKLQGRYANSKDKIIAFGDSYIGMVGSAAHNLVLRSVLKHYPEIFQLDSREAIFESYLKLHPILKEKYYLVATEEDDPEYESSRLQALIANQWGIFGIFSWREVYDYTRFWAIGSGSEYALGAMHGLYERLDSALAVAEAGVAAGAEFDDGSSLPCVSYVVELQV